jgi:hypothetical protein
MPKFSITKNQSHGNEIQKNGIDGCSSFLIAACGAGYKGSASDTSGTNGATNGTGK